MNYGGGYNIGMSGHQGLGAYQLGNMQQQQMYMGGGGGGNKQQRVIYGSVTKLFDNFGYVDDEIFFMKNIVRGRMIRVGDRVAVEAVYQPNMPVKWNAERIQLADSQGASSGGGSGYNNYSSGGRSNDRSYGSGGRGGSSGRGGTTYTADSRRHGNSISSSGAGDRHSRASRPATTDNRSTSAARSGADRDSVKRQRVSTSVSNYNVKIPHRLFNLHELSVMELRQRYSNLYIPSDFFHANLHWQKAFTLPHVLRLGQHCEFHVTHREVTPIHGRGESVDAEEEERNEQVQALMEPADADYQYSAKVMLLAQPQLADLYRQACCLAEDSGSEKTKLQHLSRLLQFVVGVKGKNEPMALGGAWSPSLDGKDVENDPQVLVNTAVRTVRALTGLDLSGCSQWYKVLELHYYRAERPAKQRPARMETVVIYLPDVWSCMPSDEVWDAAKEVFKDRLQVLLEPPPVPVPEPEPVVVKDEDPEAAKDEADAAAADAAEDDSISQDNQGESTEAVVVEEEVEGDAEMEEPVEEEADESQEADSTADDSINQQSDMDIKNMKVADLRKELEARGQSSKGLKGQLQARLQKVLDDEVEKERKNQETSEAAAKQESAVTPITEKESAKEATEEEEGKKEVEAVVVKEMSEQDKRRLKRMYTLPEKNAILVHPHPTAKQSKFDCHRMSLASLLDYRQDDTREHTFEVSLFAEQFNEMLMRDAAFCIYKALETAPEKVEEKDKVEEKKEATTEEEPESKKTKVDAEEPVEEDEETKEGEEEEEKKEEVEVIPVKMVKRTVDPQLLMSFNFFDTGHNGYIYDRDVEELVQTLGLLLSKAQVRKLVSKVTTKRDMVQFRNLTDKEVPEGGDEDITVLKETALEEELDDKLVDGNRRLLEKEVKVKAGKSPRASASASFVNAAALTAKAERLEVAQSALQLQFDLCRSELSTQRERLGRAENSESKLQKECHELREKLRTQRKSEDLARQTANIYQRLLKTSRDGIESVAKEINGQFEKEKKEKEKERERKEKERKDKEKKEQAEKEAIEAANKKEEHVAEEGKEEAVATENGKADEEMMAMMEGEFEVVDTAT